MKYIFLLSFLFVVGNLSSKNPTILKTGEKAPDFSLKTVFNEEITLGNFNKNKNIILVVLRGWPGYQCPICTKQVGELISGKNEIENKDAVVIMVYPGPSENLKKYALEFSDDFNFPNNYYFLLDPDFSMINNYNLRWDAPNETAYPSTFVINKNGIILFSKISQTHGGRTSLDDILNALN